MQFPNSLTLSRSFYQKSRDELFQFSPPAFGALYFSSIMFAYAYNSGKPLFTFRTPIVVAGHQLSLPSSAVTFPRSSLVGYLYHKKMGFVQPKRCVGGSYSQGQTMDSNLGGRASVSPLPSRIADREALVGPRVERPRDLIFQFPWVVEGS